MIKSLSGKKLSESSCLIAVVQRAGDGVGAPVAGVEPENEHIVQDCKTVPQALLV